MDLSYAVEMSVNIWFKNKLASQNTYCNIYKWKVWNSKSLLYTKILTVQEKIG